MLVMATTTKYVTNKASYFLNRIISWMQSECQEPQIPGGIFSILELLHCGTKIKGN